MEKKKRRGNFSLPEEENAKRKCSETQGKITPWKKRKEIQAKARKTFLVMEKNARDLGSNHHTPRGKDGV